jgi:hypothetical protein
LPWKDGLPWKGGFENAASADERSSRRVSCSLAPCQGSMSDEIKVFLNKVDIFAHGLNETEQAPLAHLS